MSVRHKALIAALGVVALLIAVFAYVRGVRLPHRLTEPAAVLPPGWQFYPRPTTLEPPGTVFRIDEYGTRLRVATLDVPIETGAEAFGRHTQSIRTTANILAGVIFDTASASAAGGGDRIETLEIELKGVERETTADVSTYPKIQELSERYLRVKETIREHAPDTEALVRAPHKTKDKLYIIRESISALEIDYSLSTTELSHLGGEAEIIELAEARPDLEYEKRDGFVLKQKFPKRMRVMFLAERIWPDIPVSTYPDPDQVVYVTHPVSEPLVWKEAPDSFTEPK